MGASASAAQLNVRMAPELKGAGDATLERMGILPVQLIRAVWQKLAMGEEAATQLLQSLAQKPAVGEGSFPALEWEELDRSLEGRNAFWAQLEAVAGPAPEPLSADEMLELLYEDRVEREREGLVGHAL